MRKKNLILLAVCLVAIISLYLPTLKDSPAGIQFEKNSLVIRTSQAELPFRVELALTPAQHMQGLMYRRSLPADEGMLFVYSEDSVIQMWMKNTFIPLDMLFIDRSGKILYIAENAAPESTDIISAGVPVCCVVELAGGTAKANGIKVGDMVVSSALNAQNNSTE